MFLLEPFPEPAGGRLVARVLEHPREQLVGGLLGLHVEPFVFLAREHQPRLELEQGGDQHQELGGGLQVELTGRLEVVDVGEDDLRQVDFEQVDLLAQNQRKEQVERALEDLQVEIERRKLHPGPA